VRPRGVLTEPGLVAFTPIFANFPPALWVFVPIIVLAVLLVQFPLFNFGSEEIFIFGGESVDHKEGKCGKDRKNLHLVELSINSSTIDI